MDIKHLQREAKNWGQAHKSINEHIMSIQGSQRLIGESLKKGDLLKCHEHYQRLLQTFRDIARFIDDTDQFPSRSQLFNAWQIWKDLERKRDEKTKTIENLKSNDFKD